MDKIKRALALLLAVASILTLAACGGVTDSADEKLAESEAAEYVYSPKFTKLPISGDDAAPLCMTADGMYYAALEKVGDATPEGATAEYEGQYDINEVRLYFADFSGELRKLDAFAPVIGEVTGEGKRDFTQFAHPEAMTVDKAGNLVMLEQVVSSWSDAPEDITAEDAEYFDYAKSETESFLRVLDSNGEELSRAKIELSEDDYVSGLSVNAAGQIIMPCTGSGSGIRAYSAAGEMLYEIAVDGYLYDADTHANGETAALIYDNNEIAVRIIDSERGVLGDEAHSVSQFPTEIIAGAGEYDFFFTTDTSLYGYKLEGDESERILNWVNCDVNGSSMGGISVTADGTVLGYLTEADGSSAYSFSLASLEKTARDAASEKAVLTLASVAPTVELCDAVVKFNRESENCRVELKNYYELVGETSYDDAITKLTGELAAGNMPDLLDLSDLPYNQLAAKGLLEDLYPYIDADKELSRGDFFENILSAYEVDGGLYAAVAGFGVMSVMGAESVVGDKPGWSYDDYSAALDSMPEGCAGFDWYFSRETMLQYALMIDLGAYVDWARGECRFEGDEFKALLSFAAQFPSNEEIEANAEDAQNVGAPELIAQGQQMLTMVSLYTFNETNTDNPFNTEATYIGVPNLTGKSGSAISAIESCAMTSACENKAAAWEFLRVFLTEEYQRGGYYFPTNKNAYAARRGEAMEIEYETDDFGHILLDENGERKRKIIGYMYDGSTMSEIYSGISEERAEAIDALIATADTLAQQDPVIDIALTEAQAYFAGQKSADEVARLIQSKANIYINEQK